ncbi:unnamed protein product [Caenorhabditis angaria]|uniref:F-box domain-containing protein n=1 Tax=Caenorhabditis angaria TaxID=860376 RepID=A0A9P1IEA1_9PELO|nr:unnamed protein product [Caenorhabditis angaria]
MGTCFSKWENEIEYSGGIGWFDLPVDVRRLLIDSMDFEAKARFSQCSIECYEEVSESRNFIRSIEICDGREGNNRIIEIFVSGNRKETWLFRIFELSSGNVEIRCIPRPGNPRNTQEIPPRDLEQIKQRIAQMAMILQMLLILRNRQQTLAIDQ